MAPPNQMTSGDSSRIQSSQARSGKDMSSGGFAARAQSAAATNTNNANAANSGGNMGSTGTKGSGAGSGKK
ncbi:hypothetical protein SPBR_09228 [Sporothrix brasiliensis 5110]|uniref:SMP domain-containing protein n=1 Tax=Sporothrix brasiliensis 5110 TaxID=1398154 RepID=A0A0C2F632_9PEZI|nr:uncharacterized protein SPBR_09228 [Sporothrix brasiliensis 5110]KIH94379.1 hypothetical protein SPBR_09228 [Sporothrix brasiliensis 5110]